MEICSRAGQENAIFSWGDDIEQPSSHAKSWEGEFPVHNTREDGFGQRTPVMSYPKNDFGLFDMAGNVWEWTTDWYNTNYFEELANKMRLPEIPKER
jgi:formylglycine-generating enzyme required for sulfatase activity